MNMNALLLVTLRKCSDGELHMRRDSIRVIGVGTRG